MAGDRRSWSLPILSEASAAKRSVVRGNYEVPEPRGATFDSRGTYPKARQ